MRILLSPAKTLDFENRTDHSEISHPRFLDDSEKLIRKLRRFSRKKIGELMHISPKLAELNADRYAQWLPGEVHENARPAVFAFKGDVYIGLDIESFSEEDLAFAQEHLRILSGLYGLLKPLDLIQPYRLEMGTKLKVGRKNNLYEFWGDKLTTTLNQELQEDSAPFLINLASNEYYNAIQAKLFEGRIITPNFVDWKNGKYKSISFFLKKARGMMAAWIIKHRIANPEDLASFEMEGYSFNAEMSTEDAPVFSRKLEA